MLLAGHSHACALGLRTHHRGAAPQFTPISALGQAVLALDGSPLRDETYWSTLVAHAADSTVFLVWSGNQHLVRFLFSPGRPFDFHLAGEPDLGLLPGAVLVPENLVRSVLEDRIRELDALLGRLAEVPGCRPVVLGTPAPKNDGPRLRGLLTTEFDVAQVAALLRCRADEIALTPASVRRKLWLLVQMLLRESAERTGCRFVPVPHASLDTEGFLHERYWKDDVSHANDAYGALFWRELGEIYGTTA